MQESDADTTQVSTDFNEELESLLDEDEYSNLEAITLYDEGEYVQDSINSVITALLVVVFWQWLYYSPFYVT